MVHAAEGVSFIYAGKQGSGLETNLALYGLSRKMGFPSRLILSQDNSRKELVKKLYPEAEFVNFYSIGGAGKLRASLKGQLAFFTMISPKMLPVYLTLASPKAFYFHATYDSSFTPPGFSAWKNDKYFALLHDIVIKNSDLTVATQHPLAWQIRTRLGKKAEAMDHPPFSPIKPGLFAESKKVELPFSDYFLDFGGLDRPYKGTEVLYNAVEGTRLKTVFAGKAQLKLEGKNVVHLNRWLSDPEMHWLVKNSRAVVLPYLAPSQFSGCLALAFHFRKPVIGPFSPAFEDWIDEGRTGWLFPQGDYARLRAKMEGVASGKLEYSESAIAGKEKEMEARSAASLRGVLERFIR